MHVTSVRLSRLTWISLFVSTLLFANQATTINPLQIEQINDQQSILHYQMSDFSLGEVSLASGTYERILSPHQSTLREPGAPEIPTVVTYLAVPSDGDATLSVEILNSQIIENVNLVPTQAQQLETEKFGSGFLKNDAIYTQNAWYPQSEAVLYEQAVMRDLVVAPLEVRPFQYNPVTKELRVITDLRVTVNHEQKLTAPDRPISPLFAPFYEAVIANYPQVAVEEMQRPTYLFIAPNNFAVTGILAPLMAWKHEKGFNVHLATTSETGTTTSSIKNYIQNAYDNWSDRPDLICLVGDAGGSFNIPTFNENWSFYHGEGDHPYVQLEGVDYIADAYIGRLTFATTTQLLTIVNKILAYEKTPYMDNTDWFTHAVLVGDPSSSGQSTITTSRYINEVTENFGFDNTLIFSGSFSSQMATGLNQGASYFNYRGWLGMSGWSNSNTAALSNGFMMPFVSILTCGTGSFASGEARSEAFLTAGSPSVPKGGIAAVGTATSGTHTLYNNCVSGGIYHGIFNENLHYAGGALARGWFNLNLSYPDDNGNYVEIFTHWNSLMGDPGVELWTGVPQTLTVTVPDTIPASADYLTVNVTGGMGFPIENAWVTALQGSDVVFESGYTDGSGFCVLPLEGLETGALRLTVTRHNAIPVQNDLVVANLAREMAVNDLSVDDATGNNDGQINPDESIAVTVNLKNLGTQSVDGLTGIVRVNDGGINLNDTLNLGNVAAGDSVDISGITLDVPADFPGDGIIDMWITLSADTLVWQDHVILEVYAPKMVVSALAEQGQPNPSFDPGEATTLVIYGTNLGRSGSSNLTGTLISLTDEITVEDSVAQFADGLPDEAISNNGTPFTINLSTQMTVGMQAPLELLLTDDSGFEQTLSILLPIGTPTVGDPLGQDAGGYFCYDDGDLAYALAPTFTWNSISPANLGSGTLVPLNDHGENQDDITTISLPFAFGFYGQNYSQVSISSNGYVALGASSQSTFRNWRIPGALGPNPMIAGFWDDLMLGTGSGVYTYFDVVEHKFIIEYSSMVNRYDNSTRETFQIILYDPQYYGSSDGNGDILILYNDINNVDSGTGSTSSHGNYATVGIKNQTGTIGLEYTYDNDYPVAAKPLEDHMALFFTTRTDDILPCPGWGKGDVNHDGWRNVQDLVATVNVIFGTNPGECGLWAADMNSDSLVNVSDVVLQVNSILGATQMAKSTPVQSANFQLEKGQIFLKNAGSVAGFQLDLVSEEKPVLMNHPGLNLRIGETPMGYRILGYWTEKPQSDYPIALTADESMAMDGALVSNGIGQAFAAKTTVVPESFEIVRVFPNPFNPSVQMEYFLPEHSRVSVTIYNQLGQRVATLLSQEQSAGQYTVRWQGTDDLGRMVSSGVYLAQVRAGDRVRVVKLTLMR
ncbi:MAG: T9SS type A sorting domain-containing protein [Candidatus Marinimicrobia bacterium]|nr:T9SS type A sorting domain-containing protein [Candidatus Neomarinimicrobiota bacterium]MCF7839884.1 T9SS type A sorting domain-containing protein [Candidatus Neomarinimicrobiota bacterium]